MSKQEVLINKVSVVFEQIDNQWFSDTVSIAKVFSKTPSIINRKVKNLDNFDELIASCKIARCRYTAVEDGKSYPMYKLDRDVHLFIVMGLTGKKASKYKWDFINAFNLMENIIKNTHVATKPFYKKVDEENFSKISKVNKEHGRTEEIAGYFRSTRGKELSVLFGERTRLTNRLEGLFDIEILKQLNELDERIKKIEKTKVQSKLTTKVLDVKTIGKAVSKANLEYLATGEMNEDFLEEIKYKEFERDLDI